MTALLLAVAAAPATFRFTPDPTKVYAVVLKVYWAAKHSASSLRMEMRATRLGKGHYRMDIDLVGAEVAGQDQTAALKAALKSTRVSMEWNDLAQRAGGMTRLQTRRVPPSLGPLLAEAGIYLCEFSRRALVPGDHYAGSTTASGGCTEGQYTYHGVTGKSARFTVEDIALLSGKQTQDMEFTVDPKTGVPTVMTYRIDDPAKGGSVSFRQTITARPATNQRD